MTSTPALDLAEVERSLQLIVDAGTTFEIRGLGKRRNYTVTLSGYFTDPAVAAKHIARHDSASIGGWYVTLNPVNDALRARRADRIDEVGKGETTSDHHITRRTRLLLDYDAGPVAGVSTTDAEHDAAIGLARSAAAELSDRGWPDPVIADSGNGGHLEYAIDVPTDDGGLVERVLEAAQARFGCTIDGATIKVDITNKNPSRISKVYGTVARKGDNVPERPHRLSRILSAPDRLVAVSREQLEAFAQEFAPKQNTGKSTGSTGSTSSKSTNSTHKLDVAAWLARVGLEVKSVSAWTGEGGPGSCYELAVCPRDPDHARGEAYVTQFDTGGIAAGCHHNGCKASGWNWDWLKQQHEPADGRVGASASPEPLRRATPASAPYPVDALGPVLGDAAKALHEAVQAPLAVCGQSVLAAASLAAQPHADIAIDGRRHPLTLWCMTIAESGERKTAVDQFALAPHRDHERGGIEAADRERPAYEARLGAYEAAVKNAKSKKGGPSEILAAIEACGDRPEPPPSGVLLCAEPTLEALAKIYMTGTPSLGLFTAEGSQFFGGYAMSKDHVLKSIGALATLWDEGTIERIRAGDGHHKLYGRRLALHMLMQPVIAERVLSDEVLSGQGFLARCLIASPETMAGTRAYREVDPWSLPAVQNYRARMEVLLRVSPRMSADRRGELDTRTMQLTAAAKQRWIAAYDEIEKRMGPRQPYASIRPWASKAAEQVLRMAGVLALTSNVNAPVIEADEIVRAAALIAWHLGETLRLHETAAVPASVLNAEAVLRWCKENDRRLVDARTLMREGPNRVRLNDELTEAMGLLERHGWAVLTQDAAIEGVKVKRAWTIRIEALS